MAKKKTVQDRLQTASRKWGLTQVESIYVKESRAVYRAYCEKFHEVILKIHTNDVSLASECRTLRDMRGRACCQVYDFDRENVLLLEERVLPGTALKQEPDWEKRAASFVQVFGNIHVVPKEETGYSSYLNWVKDACGSVANGTNKWLSDGMRLAAGIAEEMFKKYPERVLLHGDLHHENIVRDPSGNYVVIDPKGVMGPPIFDIPRFLLNELDDRETFLQKAHIDKMIKRLSRLLCYPSADLYPLFFMEVMLENAWCFEDGEEISEREVRFAWEILHNDIR